jgi:hypothetical protein
MGIYRTYFDRNNTIIRGSEVNTGNNPVTELAFGNRLTRFLFYVDLTDLKQKVQNKEIVLNPNTKHILRMRSTVDFSINPFLNEFKQIEVDGTNRPTSFDLELHPINQTWDEGKGYDFTLNELKRAEDLDYIKGASNWFNATSLTSWSVPGVTPTGSTLPITTQHFDKGNEDIAMDITEVINNLITTGGTYHGFVIKYANGHEEIADGAEYVTGFFTRHTQTFFEPFIETVFDDVIQDDREKFYLNKVNRLYFYCNVGGKLTNLDELPVCTINGTAVPVTHQLKGVYYATVNDTSFTFVDSKKYHDVWSNLKVAGKNIINVSMSFVPKASTEYYQLSNEMVLPTHYGISLSGIKQEEKITHGEQRRINVHVRKPYTVNQHDVIDSVSYRLYVKLGPAQMTIVDWSPVSRAGNANFFTLDTSWMVPNRYYVDIKVDQNGETLLYNDQLTFNIVSRKKL